MTVSHHTLASDMPEYKELISALKVANAHFAKLLADYEDLTREIEKIENNGINTSDEANEAMKIRRVKLKDELAEILSTEKKKEGGSCGSSCGCH